MQDSDGSVHSGGDKRGITSSTLWDSLRTASTHLQRADLSNLCDKRDLDGMSLLYDYFNIVLTLLAGFRREFAVGYEG